jgi:hypothetical protein
MLVFRGMLVSWKVPNWTLKDHAFTFVGMNQSAKKNVTVWECSRIK